MRLLYVIDSLAPGGAETSLAAMAPGLISGGIDLHVLPLARRIDLTPQLREAGATIHPGNAGGGRVGNAYAVWRAARRVRPSLVHTTLFEADVAGRAVARMMGIPSSSSLVSDSYSPSHLAEHNIVKLRAAQHLDRTTARFVTQFHAVSQAVADSVGGRLGITADRIRVIPRGRDPRFLPFRPSNTRHQVRKALNIAESTPLVLAVGRLEPVKGFQYLLEALPGLASNHPGLVVMFAGKDGRAAPALRAQAAVSPAEVRFLGHRTDVAALLAAADVLCLPSEREGSPGTLIEALAVGCPMVATQIGAIKETVGEPEDAAAVLIPPHDAEAIARALHQVLSSPSSWEKLARRGRHRFESTFTIESVSRQMTSFFHSAASTR